MIRVKCTREGLVGEKTASGYVIDRVVSFVALPDRKALFKHVRLRNPANGKTCIAQCLDIGPWNLDDSTYVFGGERPQAESGIDQFGRKTNHAAIDLGERVWKELGLQGNTEIEWEFLD